MLLQLLAIAENTQLGRICILSCGTTVSRSIQQNTCFSNIFFWVDHKADIHQLLEKPSAGNNALCAKLALENPLFLADLFELFADSNYKFKHRCGWIIRKVAQTNKQLLEPYLDVIFKVAEQSTNYKITGTVLYLVDRLLGPTEKLLPLVDTCLKQVLEPTGEEADYTATYAIKVLGKIAKVESDFKNEIIESIRIAKNRYTKSYAINTITSVLKELQ